MAIDPLEEKASMLPKLGSFWTRILQGDAKTKARKLSHIQFMLRVYAQLEGTIDSTVNGAYWDDHYRVVRFTDSDIDYYGSFAAYQKRYSTGNIDRGYSRGNTLLIEDSFVGETEDGSVVADTEQQPVVFPGGDDDTTLMDDHVAVYSLKIDPDMCVRTIDIGDGKLMVAGFDFISEFGRVTFAENPIAMFPAMKFMAVSVTRRKKSIYSYPLSVDGCYGDVSHVWHYYRTSQSPEAFRKALYQACGLPIVKAACYIKEVASLGYGCTYFTSDGQRYDVEFPHARLPRLTELKAGQAIGTDMLAVVLPGEPLPQWVSRLDMGHALSGVGSLSAPNEVVALYNENSLYRPQYTGTQPDLDSYYDTLTPAEKTEPTTPGLPVTPINDAAILEWQQMGTKSASNGYPARLTVRGGPKTGGSMQPYEGEMYGYLQEKGENGLYSGMPVICSTNTAHWANGELYDWTFDTDVRFSGRPFRFCANASAGITTESVFNWAYEFRMRIKAVVNNSFPDYEAHTNGNTYYNFVPDAMLYTNDYGKAFPDEKNLIAHVREDLFPGRHIIVCLRDGVSSAIARRALTFADRERPVGSVVLVGR